MSRYKPTPMQFTTELERAHRNGHVTLCQGHTIECSRCGLSCTVEADYSGIVITGELDPDAKCTMGGAK